MAVFRQVGRKHLSASARMWKVRPVPTFKLLMEVM